MVAPGNDSEKTPKKDAPIGLTRGVSRRKVTSLSWHDIANWFPPGVVYRVFDD
jgi:hypothetical protein